MSSADKGKEKEGAPAASGGSQPLGPSDIATLLKGMNMDYMERVESEHRFWDTQPVAKMSEQVTEPIGALEGEEKVVRKEPYSLPAGFEWCEIDVNNEAEINDAFNLLARYYVEDDDGMFRFEYPIEFLAWALRPPGYRKDWHIGVRGTAKKNLLAFITAIPATIRVGDKTMKMVEINFLCVHKKLRSKRLAPVLILEITRRVNLTGVYQAAYTAGIELPKPISCARYWHRSLNPTKLVDVGFSPPPRGNMTMRHLVKRYRVNEETTFPFEPMTDADVPDVTKMLAKYLEDFELAPVFDEEEVRHWFMPREGVVSAFVLREEGRLVAFTSFYELPSKILRHPRHTLLRAMYSFYTCSPEIPRLALMQDALILAKRAGADVYNALTIQDNNLELLDATKFAQGDGNLYYYLYNYVHPEHSSDKCGLVLM